MIWALITLYNPTDEQICNLSLIEQQVDRIVVCDNSKKNNSDRIPPYCIYSSIQKNLGISAAFNLALKNKELGWGKEDYIIFFDQDSKIGKGFIRKLIDEYEKCTDAIDEVVGCVGPIYFNTSNNRIEIPRMKTKLEEGIYEVKSIITSSMLTKYSILESVNFWNEFIFLDMTDWDLCWRLIEKKYKCCMTTNIVLHHSVGNGEKKMGPFSMRVCAPIREYYENRDALYLLKCKYTPIKYKFRFIAMLTIRNLLHIMFYDNTELRRKYIQRGIKDYKLGVYGEYIE